MNDCTSQERSPLGLTVLEKGEGQTLNRTKNHCFSALVAFISLILLGGCSVSKQAEPPSQTNAITGVKTTIDSFAESKDWLYPNASPYKPGLTFVKTPKAPSAFEYSVPPGQGVSSIYISRGGNEFGESNPFHKDWTQEIQFNDYSFKINGQTYTVPKQYQSQKILLLPIDHGIVWSPVDKPPSDWENLEEGLEGKTSIYYTPFQTGGGSLAKGEQLIAQLPHRWMGLDGPVVASAWSGWLPKNEIAVAKMKSETTYQFQFTKSDQLKSVTPMSGNVPEWSTLFMQDISKPTYYEKPHYAAYVGSLTRTYGGFVLEVHFLDATKSGRNAGMTSASYYWSEKSGKWTPLTQNYTVQTIGSWTDTGSDGVYWIQPEGVDNGLDVTEMHFDPATLTMESVWLGDWALGPSLVDGNSWVVVLPNDMPTSVNGTPKKWTVYTPLSGVK